MRNNSEWRMKTNIEPHHNNKTHTTIITSGTRSGSGRSAKKEYFIVTFPVVSFYFPFLPSS